MRKLIILDYGASHCSDTPHPTPATLCTRLGTLQKLRSVVSALMTEGAAHVIAGCCRRGSALASRCMHGRDVIRGSKGWPSNHLHVGCDDERYTSPRIFFVWTRRRRPSRIAKEPQVAKKPAILSRSCALASCVQGGASPSAPVVSQHSSSRKEIRTSFCTCFGSKGKQ